MLHGFREPTWQGPWSQGAMGGWGGGGGDAECLIKSFSIVEVIYSEYTASETHFKLTN